MIQTPTTNRVIVVLGNLKCEADGNHTLHMVL
jgi:hypothetical protein